MKSIFRWAGVLYGFLILVVNGYEVDDCEDGYGYYFSLNGNVGWHSGDKKNYLQEKMMNQRHYGGFASVGKIIGDFRTELSFMMIQTHNSLRFATTFGTRYSVDAYNFLINVFYDLRIAPLLSLYLGIGGGVCRIEYFKPFDPQDLSDGYRVRDTAPAVQGMGGLEFAVADNVGLMVGYRFFILPHFRDYHSHNVDFGIRVKF